LLKLKGIEYEERNITKDWSKDQLLEAVPNARTVPQIFINEELVGGYTELHRKLMG
jgi:glutaredoxin 3